MEKAIKHPKSAHALAHKEGRAIKKYNREKQRVLSFYPYNLVSPKRLPSITLNWRNEMKDLEISIKISANEDYGNVHIDHYDTDSIWFSLYKSRASLAFVLSVDEAKAIIAGLQKAIESKEAASEVQ